MIATGVTTRFGAVFSRRLARGSMRSTGLVYRDLSSDSTLKPSQLAGKRAAETASALPITTKSMDTLLSHAGVEYGQDNAPMSPPLSLATTYTRPPSGIYDDSHHVYARDTNPTKSMLEQTVASLECHGGGDEQDAVAATCCAFSSGMAGVNAIITAHGSSTTVLIPFDLYHGVYTLLVDVLNDLGIQYRRVDFRDIDAVVAEAQTVTSDNVVVWMETPSNPQCHVIDIDGLCSMLQASSITPKLTTVVDSTMCPPCITQPLRLGADIVFHSGTKYLGGHSDVLLGLVTISPWTERGQEIAPRLKEVQVKAGAVAAPFDSWLTLRGLRTLHVRVDRACENALSLARFLDEHESVQVVHYPGLETHPQHDIAKRQMKNQFGGVMSFEMKTESEAMAVAGALRMAQRATSLGGTETLVEHRASIEPPNRVVSPPGLLRVSVGIEHIDDLIYDFKTALAIAKEVVA